MTPQSSNTRRDEIIRQLAHRLLMEEGWPDSGNFDDYYIRAREIYDAGLMHMAFEAPIPDMLLNHLQAAPRRS